MPRDLLTTEDVARVLEVSRVSVHRWIVAGKLKCTKTPGGHRRITRKELRRFATAAGMHLPPGLLPTARLLIIDDEPHFLRAVKALLEKHSSKKLTVSLAEDGFGGLLRAADEKPDAILLDGVMKGVDGLEACRALKSNPRTKHIVVIGISGREDYEAAFLKAGADGFMLKPIDARAVVALLKSLQVVPTRTAAAG